MKTFEQSVAEATKRGAEIMRQTREQIAFNTRQKQLREQRDAVARRQIEAQRRTAAAASGSVSFVANTERIEFCIGPTVHANYLAA